MTTSAPTTTLDAPTGGLYRNVWRFAAGARLAMLGSIGLLVGSQVLKLAVPWFAGQAISALLRGDRHGLIEAALWVAGVLAVNVGVWLMHGPGRVLERTVGVRVRQGVADALYQKLTRAPLAWHDRHHSGDVQHRMAQSSQALYNFAQSQFVYLQSTVSFIGPIVALSLLSAMTGSVAVVGYLLVGFVILRFDGALMDLARQENAAERRYTSGLLDFIGNMSTLMSLRLQPSTRRLLQRRLDQVFKPLKRSIVLNEVRWCAVDLMSAALTWGLVAAFVWQSLQNGKGATGALMGSVFMVYQYAQQAGGVVGAMASSFQNFTRARTDFASADIIWQAPEQPASTATVDADWQRIDLHDLCYEHAGSADKPDEQRGGLHHVSLSLHRGERIALVGPSGSGKSTLMRVLAGLYEPKHGHVDVDGVSRLGLRHLGDASTLIPQEADVFEATVRENIAFDQACDEVSMRQALHTSAFDEVLKAMLQGLDTPISERGFNMSGGQRQRLCLARGVLAASKSSVVFLDEPTSALDSVTEARVHRRLDAAFPDACIVASVHRMSLLEHFDRVVLMVGGRIVDMGTVADLRARQPLFAQMLGGVEAEVPAEAAAVA